MTFREYGEIVGYSEAHISRQMRVPKGEMKSRVAYKLASGGFLTPYDWVYSTPKQRLRQWKNWVKKLDEQELETA